MKLDLQCTKQEAEELLGGGGRTEMSLPDWEVTLRPENASHSIPFTQFEWGNLLIGGLGREMIPVLPVYSPHPDLKL